MGLEIKIVQQGAPVVNSGGIYRKGNEIVALEIDMRSKYCEIEAYSGGEVPGLYIGASKDSLNLDETKSTEESTFIEFPQYSGWNIWVADCGRYTISVCLVKN